MSALWQRLRRRRLVLLCAGAAFLVLLDWTRPPRHQITVRAYVASVHQYQRLGHPLLRGRVKCRYEPTCSEYSVEAVERFGFPRGFLLTVKRVASCTTRVPLGTHDPVPVY